MAKKAAKPATTPAAEEPAAAPRFSMAEVKPDTVEYPKPAGSLGANGSIYDALVAKVKTLTVGGDVLTLRPEGEDTAEQLRNRITSVVRKKAQDSLDGKIRIRLNKDHTLVVISVVPWPEEAAAEAPATTA